MCLVAIAWQVHPTYPLLISANRDEFFDRPTQGLHQWESGFYAGKDLRSGGTWLGFHPNGRWALLTNYRDFISQRIAEISRGKLVQDWLESTNPPLKYLRKIEDSQDKYDGFNLLLSDGKGLWYFSNYGNGVQEIPPGIHGVSNGLLNDPWPKTELAKAQLESVIQGNPDEEQLLQILKSTNTYTAEALPKTGATIEMEIGLSAQLVRLENHYGTVSATAILQDHKGNVRMKERTFEVDYRKFADRSVSFQIKKDENL